MYELFTAGEKMYPSPVSPTTRPGGIGRFQSVTGSKPDAGLGNASRMRSNSTPIWRASVHPALSYGGVGGAPGYGKTSGCTCASNMSITCGRNAWAVQTTNEPAG